MKDTNSSPVKRQLDGEREYIRDIARKHRHRQARRRKNQWKDYKERINTKGTDNEKGGEATQDEET